MDNLKNKKQTNFSRLLRVFRIYGAFFFRKPQYIVRDPEMVKQIMVKAFDHFEDRQGIGEGANHDAL